MLAQCELSVVASTCPCCSKKFQRCIGAELRRRASSCGFRRRRTLIPKGTRTAFRAEGEQFRSVATLASRLCRKCSSSSRETYPERSAGRARKRRKGCGERGGSPFPCPALERPRRALARRLRGPA